MLLRSHGKLEVRPSYFFNDQGMLGVEVFYMAKQKKHPSKAGVSAASVKGDAGPTVEMDGGGKRNSQNNQFKKQP